MAAANGWDMVDLVNAVKTHAREHYNDGWDEVVECYDDEQIAQAIGGAKTVDGAIRNVKTAVGGDFTEVPKGELAIRYRAPDGKQTRKFGSLAEVQEYVRGRWQGVEYMDGPDGFHTDYATYTLVGCTMADLGARVGEWDWAWKELEAAHG